MAKETAPHEQPPPPHVIRSACDARVCTSPLCTRELYLLVLREDFPHLRLHVAATTLRADQPR